MNGWAAQLARGFAGAEHEVARLLHLVGQDNEVLVLGLVILGLFLGLAVAWALALGLLQGLFRLLGGGGRRVASVGGPDLRDFDCAPAMSGPERGRLDVIPSASPAPHPGRGARAVPEPVESPAAMHFEATPAPPKPETRLAQAAGAAAAGASVPLSALGGVRRVRMRTLPSLARLGPVVSARPEWTGKVVPSSLEEAGAVEVCKVLSRRPVPGRSAPVRAVDYRICGLPRVDGEGRRQPDVLVYTVMDRGFLPKGGRRPDQS